jgi:hypothetical protein
MIIVTGLPRSGTSLCMQMLEAGGIPVLVDAHGRESQPENPRGSYEYRPAMGTDPGWISNANGHAVKVVEDWLRFLPTDLDCKIIVIRRRLEEVSASRGASLATIEGCQVALNCWLRGRDYLPVFYAWLIRSPATELRRINRYLGGGLDVAGMASAIDPTLWRHRA